MTHRIRTVKVIEFPASLDRRNERAFVREFELEMNTERPAIVLDCSQLQTFDRSSVRLLLHCLEKAMKRNGDVRLTVNPVVMGHLRALGLDRLFRTFDTSETAIESFKRRSVFTMPFAASALASEHAA